MVRFKNRHILVEFLQPSTLQPTFSSSSFLVPKSIIPSVADEKPSGGAGAEVQGDVHRGEDDEDVNTDLQPELPFMLPLSSADGSVPQPKLNLGDEGGGVIYRAVRGSVQEVYGDEGWGRVASSFKGVRSSLSLFLSHDRASVVDPS